MLSRLRIVVLAVMGGLVVIAAALAAVLGGDDGGFDAPPMALIVVPLVVGAFVHGVVEAVGYRVAPIAPHTDPAAAATESGARFTQALVLRVALCESVGIASVALAFVVSSGGFWLYAEGAAASMALLAYHCLARERPIGRVQRALEAGDGESHLREALGVPPKLEPLEPLEPGVIEEL